MTTIKTILETSCTENHRSVIAAVDQIEALDHSFGAKCKVYFLRNLTIESIAYYLKYELYPSDIRADINFGGYDTFRQELLDPKSLIHQNQPDVIVLSLMLEQFDSRFGSTNWNEEETLDNLETLFSQLNESFDALIVLNTFIPPFFDPSGIASSGTENSTIKKIERLNSFVSKFCQRHPAKFICVDWSRLVRLLGKEKSMNERNWFMFQAPFKNNFLCLYAQEISKVIKAARGKAKKCLVLDCDGTLWGGIVGEDGLENIKLGTNGYEERIFLAFQKNLLSLLERGILITLCSKNNESDVWEVLESHPSCILKKEHLSAWKINWQDKATNIKELSLELNLGLDSFVFIDDSPRECEAVKQILPEVEVVQVPEKLHQFPQILFESGLFDTLSVTTEDGKRTQLYQEDSARKAHHIKTSDLEAYLESLEMVATIHTIKEAEIQRVSQLTQKTNQFNLTTKRYSKSNIDSFIVSSTTIIFSLSVADKFGDLGLTGVFIAHKKETEIVIDSFLLSCRILGRNLEYLFIDHCINLVHEKWKIEKWAASFIPTKKNQQVSKFWPKLGFHPVKNSETGSDYQMTFQQKINQNFPYITVKME